MLMEPRGDKILFVEVSKVVFLCMTNLLYNFPNGVVLYLFRSARVVGCHHLLPSTSLTLTFVPLAFNKLFPEACRLEF